MISDKLARQITLTTLLLLLSALVASCVMDTSLRDAQPALEPIDSNTTRLLCQEAQKKFPDDANVQRCDLVAIGKRYLREADTIMQRTANYNFPLSSRINSV